MFNINYAQEMSLLEKQESVTRSEGVYYSEQKMKNEIVKQQLVCWPAL